LKEKISVLIPARGDSERVPDKNLQKLGGIPLVLISVMQAEQLFPGAQIVVSTDSPDIKAAVYCDVIDRPAHLANATASTESVIKHALPYLSGEYICLLQPTNPFRDVSKIRQQLSHINLQDYDSYFTAFPNVFFTYSEAGKRIAPSPNRIRSQTMPKTFIEDGAFYLFSRRVELADDRIFGRVKILDGSDMPDINTIDDLELARKAWSPDWLT
jgi:N-acylneuraminate cytidylyltransferase